MTFEGKGHLKTFAASMLLTAIFMLVMLFVSGCGYKPSSLYAREVLGESVYADVEVYLRDPENTVLIRDALNVAIASRFKGRIVNSASEAESVLNVKVKSVQFTPLQYDKNGYVITYRTRLFLTIGQTRGGVFRVYDTEGIYDFNIEPNSVISDTKRFEAIKFASIRALDRFVSQLGIEGLRHTH